MLKNIGIQMHWNDVPSAVEIAPSNMVAKREINIIEKISLICHSLKIFRGIIF